MEEKVIESAMVKFIKMLTTKKLQKVEYTTVKEWRQVIELKVNGWILDYSEKKEELRIEKGSFYSVISTKNKDYLFDMLFILGINLQVEEEFYL